MKTREASYQRTREASSKAAGGLGGGAVSPPQWGPGRSPEKIFEISLKLFYSGAIWEARINGQTGITLAQDMIAEYSTSKYLFFTLEKMIEYKTYQDKIKW